MADRQHPHHLVDALAPTNFAATNPEVIRTTLETGGENLLKGLTNLLEDLERGKGSLSIRMTDLTAFQPGVNIAATPGKVVFQNELMQLLQYSPSTESVYRKPLLIVPPWINKFYILDLREKNSFIKWWVDQGFTVFVISWVNPDASLSEMNFEDYVRLGTVAALDAIERETGEHEVNAAGYCLGGTLLATTLAYLSAKKDKRIASATFFTAQVVSDLDRDPRTLAIYMLDGASFSNSVLTDVQVELTRTLQLKTSYRYYDVRTTFDGRLLERPFTPVHRGLVDLAYADVKEHWRLACQVKVRQDMKVQVPADFNGDQKADIVVTNGQSANVSVFLGNGTGTFAAAINYPVATQPVSVVVRDFNNDQKLDLAVANQTSGSVSLLLGNGAGSFGGATNFPVGTQPLVVVAGDFNNDQKPDVATANYGSGNASVLLGNGAGSFAAATNYMVGSSPRSLAAGDLNGDGVLDLAVPNSISNNVTVLVGDGMGGFTAAPNVASASIFSVALGDLNGDQRLDLVGAVFGSSQATIMLSPCQ